MDVKEVRGQIAAVILTPNEAADIALGVMLLGGLVVVLGAVALGQGIALRRRRR